MIKFFQKILKLIRYIFIVKKPAKVISNDENLAENINNRPEERNGAVPEDKIPVIEASIADNTSLTDLNSKKNFLENRILKKVASNRNRQILNELINKIDQRISVINSLSLDELEISRLLILQKEIAARDLQITIYCSNSLDRILAQEDNFIQNGFLEKSTFESLLTQEEIELNEILEESGIYPIEYTYEQDLENINYIKEEYSDIKYQIKLSHIDEKVEIGNPKINLETEEIINYLKSQGVLYFYHVTNYLNLGSIHQKGFLSWYKLHKDGINYENHVVDDLSRSLDQRDNLQNHVRLSFCKATPMFYAKKNKQINVIFRVSIDCLRECEYKFSNMNATDNLARIGSTLEFVKNNVKLNIALSKKPPYSLEVLDKKYYQAEIMIKEYIPAKYIIDTIPF